MRLQTQGDAVGDAVTGAGDVVGDVVTGAADIAGDVITGAGDIVNDAATGAAKPQARLCRTRQDKIDEATVSS